MRHDVQELVGSGLNVDRFRVQPVARVNVLWHEGSRWGIEASYLRAARIEVADAEGEEQVFPIPDRQLQVRLAAIAIVAVAFVIGRMRR